MQTTDKLLYAFAALVLIVAGAFAFWHFSSGTPGSLNADLYPLYTGAQWSPVKAATSTSAVGYQVVSNPITNVTDIASTTAPFETYYEQKLTQAGWVADASRQASGPGSEVSVYTKGEQFIVVSYTSAFEAQTTGAPERCPCAVQFSLISGAGK